MAAGEIRPDISPEELLRTLVGMYYTHDQPGWQSSVARLMDIFVDGLRARPGPGSSGNAGQNNRSRELRRRAG